MNNKTIRFNRSGERGSFYEGHFVSEEFLYSIAVPKSKNDELTNLLFHLESQGSSDTYSGYDYTEEELNTLRKAGLNVVIEER